LSPTAEAQQQIKLGKDPQYIYKKYISEEKGNATFSIYGIDVKPI